jgi:hypothetical protein
MQPQFTDLASLDPNAVCLHCDRPFRRQPAYLRRNKRHFCCHPCSLAHERASPPVHLRMVAADVAWLAGLLEGEGTFTLSKQRVGGKSHRRTEGLLPRVQLCMTDEDVVHRAYIVTGVGTFSGPNIPKSRGENKPSWTWAVNRFGQVIAIMRIVLPFMGVRRTEQINFALENMVVVSSQAEVTIEVI